eukprot:g7896.t1
MVTHLAALGAGGAPSLSISPRQRGDQVWLANNTGSKRRERCCGKTRSANLLAVLALAIIAGCTTVVLQLLASEQNEPRHAGEAGAGDSPELGWSDVVPPPTPSDNRPPAKQRRKPHPYADGSSIAAPSRSRRRPLVDRRFTGQRTGRPPNPEEEEIPHRPPAPLDGPFGWGTDWIAGVGIPVVPAVPALPDVPAQPGEDMIEPPWCQGSAGNRSFIDSVMERRANRADSFERVVSCTRTKDRGRYLPEWVAYHWALGVDMMDIYDDDSVDDTREVLEPFVRAGIVKFQPRRVRRSAPAGSDASARNNATNTAEALMAPVNDCVNRYKEMHDHGHALAPSWLVLLDTDEFLWGAAVGEAAATGVNTTKSLSEVLATQSTTCCLKVPVVQHGTSGFSKNPRGLLLENFLTHADPASIDLNGPPKVVLNLRTSVSGEAGQVGERGALGGVLGSTLGGSCRCAAAPAAELVVRRYPTTREDLISKGRRYAALRRQEPQRTEETKIEFDEGLETTALNDHRSDEILAWRCVVRRVLSRVADGRHVITGRPQGSLSPHHPIAHGISAMDPNGEFEEERRDACVAVARSSPTVAGTAWGPVRAPLPVWLTRACSTRFVFVHSFEDTGEQQLLRMLNSHPWTRSHTGAAAVSGCTLTSAIPSAEERKKATPKELSEMCGCTNVVSPGCWRYCPKLQRSLLTTQGFDSDHDSNNINRTRRQLVLDWLLPFGFESEPAKPPAVLVETDPDFLVASKQGLFPFVSTSVLTVRHPLCSRKPRGRGGDQAGLREWREVWEQVLVKQVPHAKGPVWVVRFEDLLSQEEEATSALWAAVGLPPVSPYAATTMSSTRDDGRPSPRNVDTAAVGGGKRSLESRGERQLIAGDALSRASSDVRNRAIPPACRARVAACEKDPACALELLRSASLLDYFGYGGEGAVLLSQRFLWGKEELEWLGERLVSEQNDAAVERLHMLTLRDADGAVNASDDDGEPSIVLPQAPRPLKSSTRRPGVP